MLRVEVSEAGQGALPAIDLDEAVVVIGGGADARIRLPGGAVRNRHVVVEGGRWRAGGEVRVDGVVQTGGELGEGVELEIAGYRVRLGVAPPGAVAAPVQRTESLARELVRSLLGTGGAPSLEIERGPLAGAKRLLAPPPSVLVIGRGDEASWVVLDEDLSRIHAEIRREWDGARIVDLASKNGTRLDGVVIGENGSELRDGAVIALGNVVMRYRDPAERHLRGERSGLGPGRDPDPDPDPSPSPSPDPSPTRNPLAFYAALTIMLLAFAGLVWTLG